MSWPLIIISLSDAERRRTPLIATLDRLQIGYEIFRAIDGRNGLSQQYESRVNREGSISSLGRELSDAEYACALSHCSVYERIVKQDLSGAIVLEDDAIIGPEFKDLIDSASYSNFDFLQFDYNWARVWRFGLGTRQVTPAVKAKRILHNAGLATGYALSTKAARFILEKSIPVSLPADWPCDLSPIKPSVTVPRIVGHPPADHEGSHLYQPRNVSKRNAKELGLVKSPRARNPKSKTYNYFGRFLSYYLGK